MIISLHSTFPTSIKKCSPPNEERQPNVKYFNRIFLSLLTLSLLFVSACNKNTPGLDEGYLMDGNLKTTPDWVLKLNDTEISFAEYRHFYLNAKLDMGDDSYFAENPSAEETLKTTVLSYLAEAHALNAIAAEHGIQLDQEERNALKDEIAATKKEMGDELYAQMLNDYFFNDEVYLLRAENNALYEKTYEALVGDGKKISVSQEELRAYLAENQFCYAQIYVDFLSGEGTDVHTNTDAKAATIMERLKAGEDFYKVAFDDSDDQTMIDYKYGYLTPKSALTETQAKTLSSLAEGEISEPLLENDGYYIYLRMPISDEVIEENRKYLLHGYEDANGNHINGMYENRFYALIAEYAKGFEITYADCYSAISTQTLF